MPAGPSRVFARGPHGRRPFRLTAWFVLLTAAASGCGNSAHHDTACDGSTCLNARFDVAGVSSADAMGTAASDGTWVSPPDEIPPGPQDAGSSETTLPLPADVAFDSSPQVDENPRDLADAAIADASDTPSNADVLDAPVGRDTTAEASPVDPPPTGLPPGELVGFTAASGTFSAPFAMRLIAAGPDVRLFFSVDGSLPTLQSRPWTGADAILVTATTAVRVLAVRGQEQQIRTGMYLHVTPALAAGFTSNLPLVFLHAFAPTEPEPSNYANTVGGMVITAPVAGVARPVGNVDTVSRVGFKVRGRSSRVWDQRSYAVELWDPDGDTDHPLPVLGMPAESDWVLYGPWTVDRTLLRNAFLYGLSNRIGRYAPRTRFVEVFIQSAGKPIAAADYRGVYTLIEKVKRDPQRVNIANLRPADGAEPAITGGYLFKVDDQLAPGEIGLMAAGQSMELEDPRSGEITPAQRAYLTTYLNDAHAAIKGGGGRHPTTGLHYSDYIDVDSFIDFHIMNVFARNPDAFRLSAYYHKDRGKKLVAGPLWDLDRTTGANDERVLSPEGWSAPLGTDVFSYGWWGGLFKDPAFEMRYWARWEALLASDLRSDVFSAIIGPMATELATAQQRHFDRWPSVRPQFGYLPEVLRLSSWLDARVAWVKSHLRMR